MSTYAFDHELAIQDIIRRREDPRPERDPDLQRNLDRVEELLSADPISAEGIVIEGGDPDGVEFEMKADSGPNLDLERLQFVKGRAQLLRAVIPTGAHVANHDHEGLEFLYVVRGELRLSIRGQPDHILRTGDSCVIPEATGHVASAMEESHVLAFLVPPDRAYAEPE